MRNRTTFAILSLTWLLMLANALQIQNEGITNNETYRYNVSENTTLALTDYEQESHIAKRGLFYTKEKGSKFDLYYKRKNRMKYNCDESCYQAVRRQVEIFVNQIDNLPEGQYELQYEKAFTIPHFDTPRYSIRLYARETEVGRRMRIPINFFELLEMLMATIMRKQFNYKIYQTLELEYEAKLTIGQKLRTEKILYVDSTISIEG